MIAGAFEKAGSTDPMKVAFALEGMTYAGPSGNSWMRAEDHQMIAPIYIMKFTKAGQPGVKYDEEGTGYGWKTEVLIEAQDIIPPISAIERDRLQALLIFDNPLTEVHLDAIMRLAAHRLPVVSEGRDWVKEGALLAYGADYHDMWKHGAVFVDRILKGAKPGDLPFEQPTKFNLLVNMRTANALGIAIPQSILLRADEIIR